MAGLAVGLHVGRRLAPREAHAGAARWAAVARHFLRAVQALLREGVSLVCHMEVGTDVLFHQQPLAAAGRLGHRVGPRRFLKREGEEEGLDAEDEEAMHLQQLTNAIRS